MPFKTNVLTSGPGDWFKIKKTKPKKNDRSTGVSGVIRPPLERKFSTGKMHAISKLSPHRPYSEDSGRQEAVGTSVPTPGSVQVVRRSPGTSILPISRPLGQSGHRSCTTYWLYWITNPRNRHLGFEERRGHSSALSFICTAINLYLS